MPKIIKLDNDKPIDKYNSFFLFIKDISDYKKIKPSIQLCIIKSDFSKSDLANIKKLQSVNKNTEFWISTNKLSRENILIANKAGIKNVISSPFDKKIVEDFFVKKNINFYASKSINNKYDYSCVSNSKVLIVDDHKMNVELLEEILSDFQINISSFTKPKEAYRTLLNEKFDLILLDVMMPEMSGFELAKKVRNDSLNKNIPIVFISALSDSRSKIKGYDLGSLAYIEKPFDVNIVKSQIFNLLKNQRNQETINLAKESFLATVAHDLKTPINAGINALNLLLNENLGSLKDMQYELIEDLLNSSKFMKNMVDNVLCKNKIENSTINLSKQIYSLNEIVVKSIEVTKHLLSAKNQKIELFNECDNTLVPFDFIAIQRAVINLISNASEYSPVNGKIVIRIFIPNENKIAVSVQDFGQGIDIINQADIFQEYISFANKYKKVGTGLGLYITKKIIEAHDGEIYLESKVGSGTTITFNLPIYVKE